MGKLEQVLNQTISEIENKINSDFEIKEKENREKYFKSIPDIKIKQNRLTEISEQIEMLNKEKQDISNDIDNLDPSISISDVEEVRKTEGLDISIYGCKKSKIETARMMMNTKEFKNKVAFKAIKRQINSQFNLAITQKQKQQVIIGLQNSVDWKSLGINIPNLFEITKIEINNGILTIDNALPNPKN